MAPIFELKHLGGKEVDALEDAEIYRVPFSISFIKGKEG